MSCLAEAISRMRQGIFWLFFLFLVFLLPFIKNYFWDLFLRSLDHFCKAKMEGWQEKGETRRSLDVLTASKRGMTNGKRASKRGMTNGKRASKWGMTWKKIFPPLFCEKKRHENKTAYGRVMVEAIPTPSLRAEPSRRFGRVKLNR